MTRGRRILLEAAFEHSGRGLDELVLALLRLSDNDSERISVAIEVPRGAIVETLLERGIAVFSINPKQRNRFRYRHTVSGPKMTAVTPWYSRTRCVRTAPRFTVCGLAIRCSSSYAS